MKKIIPILSIFLISCSGFTDQPIYEVDQELEPYYLIFLEEGRKRGIELSGKDIMIHFGNRPGSALASHINRMDHVVEIEVDFDKWNEKTKVSSPYTRNVREVTMFHEFGHGLLYRNHNSNCSSIMMENSSDKGYCKYENYEQNREEMLDELFEVQ